MAATRGRLMLIKIGTAATGTLLMGLKNTTFKMNNTVVDVSTKDTNGWRELLEDGSLKFFTISGTGIFKDSATDATIRDYVLNNTLNTFTFIFPNGDTIECEFQITTYERSGAESGAETYSITLESTGIPTITIAS